MHKTKPALYFICLYAYDVKEKVWARRKNGTSQDIHVEQGA